MLRKYGYDVRLRQRGFLTPQEVGRVRNAIREGLEDILNEIDKLVLEILGSYSEGEEGILKYLTKTK